VTKLCDECETVAHCLKHGCIPKVQSNRTIDMAREAGAIHIHKQPKEFAIVGNDSIKAFEALVRADEREACAKMADLAEPYQAADLIRARGNT
jgi:hypothetical protein